MTGVQTCALPICFHFLASDEPIPETTASELVKRLPPRAASDLVEWSPGSTPVEHFSAVLGQELSLDALIGSSPGTRALQDDQPVNEYYFVRWLSGVRTSPGD